LHLRIISIKLVMWSLSQRYNAGSLAHNSTAKNSESEQGENE